MEGDHTHTHIYVYIQYQVMIMIIDTFIVTLVLLGTILYPIRTTHTYMH